MIIDMIHVEELLSISVKYWASNSFSFWPTSLFFAMFVKSYTWVCFAGLINVQSQHCHLKGYKVLDMKRWLWCRKQHFLSFWKVDRCCLNYFSAILYIRSKYMRTTVFSCACSICIVFNLNPTTMPLIDQNFSPGPCGVLKLNRPLYAIKVCKNVFLKLRHLMIVRWKNRYLYLTWRYDYFLFFILLSNKDNIHVQYNASVNNLASMYVALILQI